MTTIADRASVVAADLSPTDKIPVHRTGQAGGNSITLANVAQYINGGAAIATNNPVANMVGDGVTDNLSAWNSIISAYDTVVIPPGTYLFSQPMDIPKFKTVQGMGFDPTYGTLIKGTSGQAAVIRMDLSLGAVSANVVSDLVITGASTKGLSCDDVTSSVIKNIQVSGFTGTDAIVLHNCFNNQFENMFVGNSTVSGSCYVMDGYFNANHVDSLVTSQACTNNFLIDGGQASAFTNLTAQVGTTGFWVRSGSGHTFNGMYTENVALPLKLGDYGVTRVRTSNFSGLFLVGPTSGHSGYSERITCIELDYVHDCTFSGVDFEGHYSAYAQVAVGFTGGGGSGAAALARVHPDGQIHSVQVLSGGTGYTANPTVGFTPTGGGSGATATAARTDDAVTSVTVTAGGSGYSSNERLPSAIRISGTAYRVTFIAPNGRSLAGISDTFYPSVVRKTGAESNSRVTLLGIKTSKQSTSNAVGNMYGVPGYDFSHYLRELSTIGTDVSWNYIPPIMDT